MHNTAYFRNKISKALAQFPSKINEDFPETLPLLEDYRKNHQKNNRLKNTEVLLIQHHLGPLLKRLDALFADGLRPENTWLVDIPYSTNERVRKEIPKRYNIPLSHTTTPHRNPIAPYHFIQQRRVMNIIYEIAGNFSGKHLLVIDDGAYFIRALHTIETFEPGFSRIFKGRVSIVEQTTRGHNYLIEPKYKNFLESTIHAPAVSIARCITKKFFEGPFIGAAAAKCLIRALKREDIKLADFDDIAIIGFGVVGKAVFNAITEKIRGHNIHVIEPRVQEHKTICKFGGIAHTSLPSNKKFDMIIGCTGTQSFSWNNRNILSNDAYLISTSSATIEFNREHFIERALTDTKKRIYIENYAQTIKQGIRASIKIKDAEKNKKITFVSGTFPVNFDGKMECMPIEFIQPTHTLLYAAGYQALETTRPGLKKISTACDKIILDGAIRHI